MTEMTISVLEFPEWRAAEVSLDGRIVGNVQQHKDGRWYTPTTDSDRAGFPSARVAALALISLWLSTEDTPAQNGPPNHLLNSPGDAY